MTVNRPLPPRQLLLCSHGFYRYMDIRIIAAWAIGGTCTLYMCWNLPLLDAAAARSS